MAEKNETINGSMYNHPMWSMHRFVLLRIFLMILILGIVFSVGMQIGELKGMIKAQYGIGYHEFGDRRMGNMMYYNPGAPVPTPATTTPAAGTKSTTNTTTTTNTNNAR